MNHVKINELYITIQLLHQLKNHRCQHMHPEKAKVVAGAYAGDDEILLGVGGSGFLNDDIDFIKVWMSSVATAADSPEIG